MSGYRSDSRPTCASCKRAFDASELSLAEDGSLECRSCGANAGAAAIEKRGALASALQQRRALALGIGGLASVVATVALFLSSHKRAAREIADRDEALRATRASLAPVLDVLEHASTGAHDDCTGEIIEGSAVWLLAEKSLGGRVLWSEGYRAPLFQHPSSSVEARYGKELVADRRYFVVLLTTTERQGYWSGDLVLVDRTAKKLVCSSPLSVDGAAAHLSVDASVLHAQALEVMPRSMTLVN